MTPARWAAIRYALKRSGSLLPSEVNDVVAEVDRFRAQVAAVEALTKTWEAIPSQLLLDTLKADHD